MSTITESWPATCRAKCLKLLTAHIGEGGVREFLRQRQPSFDDRLGSDILQSDPQELLRRLVLLDGDHDDIDDHAADAERKLDVRRESEAGRLVALLEDLERGAG
jgi:hypothetical protein